MAGGYKRHKLTIVFKIYSVDLRTKPRKESTTLEKLLRYDTYFLF